MKIEFLLEHIICDVRVQGRIQFKFISVASYEMKLFKLFKLNHGS